MTSGTDRWAVGLFAAALASSLGLCIPALRGQPLALDEHVSYFASGAPRVSELVDRSLGVMATPPLSHLVERASLASFGRSETALRLPSLLGYVAAVGFAFLLGRHLGGPVAGSLTALLLAWHPEVLDEVRIARCYGLELALAGLTSWGFVRWADAPPRLGNSLIWLAGAVALLWTHYLSAPLIAASVLLGAVRCVTGRPAERTRRSGQWALVVVTLALTAWPLVPSVLRLSDWTPALSYRGGSARWQELVGPVLMIAGPLLALLAAGRWLLQARGTMAPAGRALRAAVWLWLVPTGAFLFALVADNATLLNVRYRIPLAPVGTAVLCCLLVRLAGRRAAFAVVALVLCGAWWQMPHWPFQAGRLGTRSDALWRDAAIELRGELARPDTLVFAQTGLTEAGLVTIDPDNQQLQKYAACRLGGFYTRSEAALPIVTPMPGAAGPPDVAQKLNDRAIRRVFVVGATDTDLNRLAISRFESELNRLGLIPLAREDRIDLVVDRWQRSE